MHFLFLLFVFTSLFANEDLSSLAETSHIFKLKEQEMAYKAITGTIPVSDGNGDDLAEIFFIAYFKEEEGETQRPITFFLPGGPGGSSAPMVMCSIGPRRILTPDEGKSLLPPYQIIDNPEAILSFTDLIFIDPVGSGYSTISDEEDLKEVFSVEGDIQVLGDFIRSFISYFERWNSPKYLAGFSYGTTRCCGLAENLLHRDLSLHGIILLGSATDFSTLVTQQNQSLPECLSLPTYAATAWYYGRLWPEKSLQEVLEYARRFTLDSYIPAMFQPTRLSPFQQESFYQELSLLLGLPLDTIKRYQGRFNEITYTTEFFASDRKIIGGLDTRYIGDSSMISRFQNFEDPSYRDMQGIHCAFNNYLQKELDTNRPLNPYIDFCVSAFSSWNYSTFDSFSLPDLFQRIRRTLIANPEMKIFVGSGYYDCRTPFAATEYCFDHLQLPSYYQENFQFEYYEAGHGFIFDHPSLKKLKQDLQHFYERKETSHCDHWSYRKTR